MRVAARPALRAATALLLAGIAPAVARGFERPPLPDGSVYRGEYREGRFHGMGRLEWPSGARYVGQFERGQMHGLGRMTERNGSVYEGSFAHGLPQGAGRRRYPGGARYEGQFRNGLPNGRGVFVYRTGDVYFGQMKDGDFEGTGILVDAAGNRYEGEFRDDLFHGTGRLVTSEGAVYEGGFAEGEFEGAGTYRDANGQEFSGEFHAGRLTGGGRYRSDSGTRYVGDFVDWDFEGEGVLHYADGSLYVGAFHSDRPHGRGTYVRPDGMRYEGEFVDGRFAGEGRLFAPDGGVYEGGFEGGRFEGRGRRVRPWRSELRVEEGWWQKGQFAGDGPEPAEPTDLEAESLLFRQGQLVKRALDAVAPSRPGVPELYFVGFAGWGDQDVFRHEVLFADDLFEARFGTGAHSVVLLTHPDEVDSHPLATVTNLRAVLRGLADRMDPSEDILFLFLTSHGSAEHGLAVRLQDLPLRSLAPDELASMLRDAGIGWKVVVVSACYSGGFVDPLSDSRSLVITAARSDRPSFGCSDDATFTWFGGSYFRDALAETPSFVDAFRRAARRIRALEAQASFEASEPQMRAGREIEPKLAEWRRSLETVPPAASAP